MSKYHCTAIQQQCMHNRPMVDERKDYMKNGAIKASAKPPASNIIQTGCLAPMFAKLLDYFMLVGLATA